MALCGATTTGAAPEYTAINGTAIGAEIRLDPLDQVVATRRLAADEVEDLGQCGQMAQLDAVLVQDDDATLAQNVEAQGEAVAAAVEARMARVLDIDLCKPLEPVALPARQRQRAPAPVLPMHQHGAARLVGHPGIGEKEM